MPPATIEAFKTKGLVYNAIEDKYYDIYQKVGNDIFTDLFSKIHSNIRQFFPLEELQERETYLWFENDELVGSIRINHNKEENCYEKPF